MRVKMLASLNHTKTCQFLYILCLTIGKNIQNGQLFTIFCLFWQRLVFHTSLNKVSSTHWTLCSIQEGNIHILTSHTQKKCLDFCFCCSISEYKRFRAQKCISLFFFFFFTIYQHRAWMNGARDNCRFLLNWMVVLKLSSQDCLWDHGVWDHGFESWFSTLFQFWNRFSTFSFSNHWSTQLY